jgi:nicotinamide mononucleotide (NMN) deamidase PncC
VGTVWLAVADKRRIGADETPRTQAALYHLEGDRSQVRQTAVHAALELLVEVL